MTFFRYFGVFLAMVLMVSMARESFAQHEPGFFLNGAKTNEQLSKRLNPETAGIAFSKAIEPEFPQIQFYEIEPPKTLTERIESLLYGITMDLPPEYDYYGYELRRYMASIGGQRVFANRKDLREAINNTKRAAIVIDKWQKDLLRKVKVIEEDMEQRGAEPSERTLFKFKKSQMEVFLDDSRKWVKDNETMLLMLYELEGRYEYIEPNFNFATQDELMKFVELYDKRQKSLKRMHEYTPFRMMIY